MHILSRVSLFCWYLPVQKNSLFSGCRPQKQLLIQKNVPFLGQHDLPAPNERPVPVESQMAAKKATPKSDGHTLQLVIDSVAEAKTDETGRSLYT